MRVLITGITGFVGSHMADYLIKNVPNIHIYGLRRWRSRYDNVQQLYKNPNVTFIEGDLTDRSSLSRAIRISKPDIVYHFASQSFPESSFVTPILTLTTNVLGTTNLLEELRDSTECDPVIISVSSSEVYGNPTKDEIPITESNPIRAAIWSTTAKLMMDMPALFFIRFFNNHGLLQIKDRSGWWVIKNGSKEYVEKLIEPFQERIRMKSEIKTIKRSTGKIIITHTGSHEEETFDAVVIATHSNQALELLADATEKEQTILGAIPYQTNSALLHTTVFSLR